MKAFFALLALALSISVQSQNTNPGMVLIPGGEFTMGKNTPNPTDWQPEHKVRIDSFYMDKCEVTNKEYYDFCIKTNTPLPEFWGQSHYRSGLDFPEFPVVGVNFFDADKYARWAGKRLPTEAEWEFGARGGLVDNKFPWGDQIDSTKVNFGKRYKGIVKVGSFSPNAYGLFDMAGNVWEWTSDNYGDDYYANSPIDNPKGPETGRFKVIRGGGWHSGAMCNQTFFRNGLSPSWVDFAGGFRCVKSAN
jgi:formylglycine-generating enzyme